MTLRYTVIRQVVPWVWPWSWTQLQKVCQGIVHYWRVNQHGRPILQVTSCISVLLSGGDRVLQWLSCVALTLHSACNPQMYYIAMSCSSFSTYRLSLIAPKCWNFYNKDIQSENKYLFKRSISAYRQIEEIFNLLYW